MYGAQFLEHARVASISAEALMAEVNRFPEFVAGVTDGLMAEIEGLRAHSPASRKPGLLA